MGDRMIGRRDLVLSGTAALIAAALPSPALAKPPADDPANVVTGIYTRASQGKGDSGGNFVVGNKVARSKYLSKSLAALWARAEARTRKGEAGPIDFDPVTNSQDPDVKSFRVTVEKQEGDKTAIAVTIEGHQGPRPKPADQTVRYHLVREEDQWKIDDIRGTADERPWSVRSILAASLRN